MQLTDAMVAGTRRGGAHPPGLLVQRAPTLGAWSSMPPPSPRPLPLPTGAQRRPGLPVRGEAAPAGAASGKRRAQTAGAGGQETHTAPAGPDPAAGAGGGGARWADPARTRPPGAHLALPHPLQPCPKYGGSCASGHRAAQAAGAVPSQWSHPAPSNARGNALSRRWATHRKACPAP